MQTILKKYRYYIAVVLGAGAISLGALTDKYDTLAEIKAAEDAYFATNGKYLQVLPGNKLPHYEAGTVSSKIGRSIGENIKVVTYITPEGVHGYQVIFDEVDNVKAFGFGPMAESLTYTFNKPGFASTTSK